MHDSISQLDHGANGALGDDKDTGDGFAAIVKVMQSRLTQATTVLRGAAATTLLTVDTSGLFEMFLTGLPAELRQHYTCNTCKSFVRRYGGLVVVDDAGNTYSAVWPGLGEFLPTSANPVLANAIGDVRAAIATRPIVGPFLSDETTWGTALAGGWDHFAIVPPSTHVYGYGDAHPPILTANQRAAELRENHTTLLRALGEFSRELVLEARGLLRDGTLQRPEKGLPLAEWLIELYDARAAAVTPAHCAALTWRAAVRAPDGWCKFRSGLLGSLLEDLSDSNTRGLSGLTSQVIAIAHRWNEKVGGDVYMRPTAPVKAGNVKQAEDLVAKLGIRDSLRRRFATLDDVRSKAAWLPADARPTDNVAAAAGADAVEARSTVAVFGHLLAGGRLPRGVLPAFGKAHGTVDPSAARRLTWEKFSREVLPDTQCLQYLVAPRVANYGALVTAVDPAAPPVLKWDDLDNRNPFSWYLYVSGSEPERWALPSSTRAGTWVDVKAVVLKPCMWPNLARLEGCGKGVVLVLNDARDLRARAGGTGGGLFPEDLKSELHAVRSTIEHHVNTCRVEGVNAPDLASGLLLSAGPNEWQHVVLRALRSDGTISLVRLDRWD